MEKQIEQLTAAVQKVSAQLELRKPALQTVKNEIKSVGFAKYNQFLVAL